MSERKVKIHQNENSNLIPVIKLPHQISTGVETRHALSLLNNPQLIEISQNIFQENGVLQIDNLFSQDAIAKLYKAFYNNYQSYFNYREYADSLEIGDKRRMITIDVKDEFNNPDFYANSYLLGLMQKVLGEELILGSYGVVIALPGAEHQHVHRDHPSLFSQEEIDVQLPSFAVTAVIPLVDLTEETGSTRVWKKSHRQGRSQREFPMSHSDVPYMSTGSCYLMDYQLVHGGTANVSDIVRPILYLIYYRSWFREIVNFEKQDRINITPAEYQKVPDRYKFLFSDLSVSKKDKVNIIDNRETVTPPLTPHKKFAELDAYNQEQRLTELAKGVLSQYGLENYRLRLISHRENTTFSLDIPRAVTQTEGNTPFLLNRYLLRIYRSNYLSPNGFKSELQWLQALRQSNFPVPEPVPNQSGELITIVESSGIPEPRVCSVTKWVYGEDDRQIDIKSIGKIIAQLHLHGANWQPPANFERPRWDWEGLFGKGAGYSIDRGDEIWQLTPQPYRDLFRRVGDRYKQLTEILGTGKDQFGLIHADLCPANLLYAHNQVRPIDFADCGYGYWVQDLAMFLSYYARDPKVPIYLKSLLEGYAQVRPLPAKQLPYIDTFITVQYVTLALWRINRAREHPYFRSIVENSLIKAAEHARWFLEKCPPVSRQLIH